ncbi:alpha-L-rhamnosidase [Streptomyces aurantiacus]|uniref:family 78 glycoside hydrolase catalytic domain n=1 Tax=Streptomyces aurantiacus TaxID=47760 RepID=UPI00278D6B7D|nr:family 78 glycoside hydrolase catalytic domain [Streptomyces aurantiacus]MDQ0776121.1 alpha-L-rhamnosidase [Streptomyces aurantiacus]
MSSHLSRRTVLQLGAAASAAVVLTGPAPQASAAAPGKGGSGSGGKGAPPAPTGLLTDLLPQGLGTAAGQRPRFSWQVPDFGPGTRQRAYQLEVATTPDGFGKHHGKHQLVWSSGKVAAAESTAVAYGGPPLKPRTAYWWRVSSWGDNREEIREETRGESRKETREETRGETREETRGVKRSSWSEPVLMATAVEDEWQAEPIWAPAGPTMTDGTFATRLKITAVAAGLWFRATDTANNYMWQLRADSTAAVLRKHVCVNGTYSVLGDVTLPFPVATGEWVDLSVTLTGATFTTSVNGTVVDTTTHTRYSSGGIGLRNGRTESQVYDSVRFTAADGTVLLQDDFASDRGTFGAGTVANGVLTFPAGASSLSSYGADDTWALLRHEYDLAPRKKIAAAVLHVAATSPGPARQYVAKVWSNGSLVGYASVRSGSGVAYQSFDITGTLRAGRANALAALCHSTSQRKFLAQLEITYTDGSRATIGSGGDWKARRQAGLLPARGSAGSTFFTAPQEYWDLRNEPIGWTEPGFDDAAWLTPAPRSAIDGLVPALIEPVRLHDVTPASVTRVADGRWLVDLGREIAGGLALEVDGNAGDTVEVRLGEELDADADADADGADGTDDADSTVKYQLRATNVYREVWTLRDGAQRFEHWGYRGFRWAELRTSVDLSRATVKGRAWRLDWDDSDSSFSSSDPDLDRVWDLCRYSIEATRGDLYQDTPTRERGPYEGDALINQLSEYGVQRSFALARWSNDYLVRQGTWPTEYRLMCAISAWEDYLATGDDRQLAKDYALLAAKNLTSYLGSDGLVHKAPGNSSQDLGDLVDWPVTNRDGYVFTSVNTVVNAFQYAAFDALAKCAAVLGDNDETTLMRKRADTLAAAMRDTLLDTSAGRFRDGAGTTHSAQHATAFPVALGVDVGLDDEVLARIGDTLAEGGMKVSVYGAQFLLDALFRLGRADAALALLTSRATNSWLHMIDDLNATIVTEAWDPSLKPNMTFSHAWASAPANAVARHVLGVQVTEAGAAGFRVRPRTGKLTEVDGTVPSLRGPVSVSLRRAKGTHSLKVTLPPNTRAVVELEIGDTDPAAYRAAMSTVGRDGHGHERVDVNATSFEDLTGTVLRVGPVGSGTTVIALRG